MKLAANVRDYFSKLGKKSAKARMEKMTPEDRRRVSQIANAARRKPKP